MECDLSKEEIEAIVEPERLFQRRSFKAYDYFNSVLGSPRHVVAPMIDQSELAFRILCRRYNSNLCYTPMLHADQLHDPEYRRLQFQTCPEDSPLVAQICGSDWKVMLEGAKFIESQCAAIDINLGCPQGVARRGNFGAFLMDDIPRVKEIVENLSKNLSIPLFCKIRVFPAHQKTIEYAQMLEEAGCQLLCIHGRTRDMKKPSFRDGRHAPADWPLIRKIKSVLTIPVIANGSIEHFQDVERCIQETGVDGVMSALSVLENPAFFSGNCPNRFRLCYEYLNICRAYPPPLSWIRSHLWKILKTDVSEYEALRDKLFDSTKTIDDIEEVIRDLEEAVKNGVPPVSFRPPKYIPESIDDVLEDFAAFPFD